MRHNSWVAVSRSSPTGRGCVCSGCGGHPVSGLRGSGLLTQMRPTAECSMVMEGEGIAVGGPAFLVTKGT